MWEVSIVEDDREAADTLQGYLERYAIETRIEYHITQYDTGEGFLAHRERPCQLVFMDIDMPGLNGLDAAKRLRASDREVLIVFVTNMAQYALEGYSVAAADYLIKPVDYELFRQKLRRLMELLAARTPQMVFLDVPGGMLRVDVGDVEYIEVIGHQSVIHMGWQRLALRKPLGELEELFSRYQFLRCNKCYLVNPARITGVYGGFVAVGETKLQISRNRRKDFMEAFARWAGQQNG